MRLQALSNNNPANKKSEAFALAFLARVLAVSEAWTALKVSRSMMGSWSAGMDHAEMGILADIAAVLQKIGQSPLTVRKPSPLPAIGQGLGLGSDPVTVHFFEQEAQGTQL
jgi:hypothetical protein